MEPTQDPNTEATTPKQSTYISIDQWIGKMTLAFDNALLPEIFETMETVGYTVEKITGMKAQLSNLVGLHQTQIKEYAEQYEETEKFNLERKTIDTLFVKDRALTKILFKGNVHAQAILRFSDINPTEYSAWVQLLNNFYTQISAPDLLTKASTVGVNAGKVTLQKQALVDLQIIKDSQSKEVAEAQQATDTRNRAFDELYPLYAEYIKYARILLADNQILEAIGIKVKHK